MTISYGTVQTADTIKTRGSLAAGATEDYAVDCQKTGNDATPKDNLDLNVWVEVHASSTSGVLVTAIPLNVSMADAFDGAQHMRYAQDVSAISYTFTSDVLKTTVNDGAISGGDATLILSNTNNLSANQLLVFDNDLGNSYVCTNVNGTTITLDRTIAEGASGNNIVNGDAVVRRQGVKIPLDGVPCLGWLITLKNLDATYAATVEAAIHSTAGSTLA